MTWHSWDCCRCTSCGLVRNHEWRHVGADHAICERCGRSHECKHHWVARHNPPAAKGRTDGVDGEYWYVCSACNALFDHLYCKYDRKYLSSFSFPNESPFGWSTRNSIGWLRLSRAYATRPTPEVYRALLGFFLDHDPRGELDGLLQDFASSSGDESLLLELSNIRSVKAARAAKEAKKAESDRQAAALMQKLGLNKKSYGMTAGRSRPKSY